MKNPSWFDIFWLVFNVAVAAYAVIQGHALSACFLGFSAVGVDTILEM